MNKNTWIIIGVIVIIAIVGWFMFAQSSNQTEVIQEDTIMMENEDIMTDDDKMMEGDEAMEENTDTMEADKSMTENENSLMMEDKTMSQ